MQPLITLFLWTSYCVLRCIGLAMDNTHITLRVRNGIKKLPYSSKNNADDKRNWQLITNEFGKFVGQLAEWLRRWTANLLSSPTWVRVSSWPASRYPLSCHCLQISLSSQTSAKQKFHWIIKLISTIFLILFFDKN